MRKLFVMMLAMVPALASGQGLDLSWNSCVGYGAETANKAFVCSTIFNQNYTLEFQYKVPADIPNFVSITAFADIGPIGAPLAPFWHYETGGCNGSEVKGVLLRGTFPIVCEDLGIFETWDGGPSGTFAIAAYGADSPEPGGGHFILLGARDDAVPVRAGVNYWAFELRFNNRNRSVCGGCYDDKILTWQTARLESNDGSSAVDLQGPDKFGDSVRMRGVDAVPVRTTTWGQIKSIFR